ncbi:hypothetical protein [Chlorella virus XW01]|nr:hypothetical protein [Chlorella virus XW01]
MINKDKIDKIFSLKLKLTDKKDKMKLSQYTEYIPMFDIYTLGIYPIKNINIHTRLSDSHYRFINDEIYNWIKNMLDNKLDEDKINRLKKNLKILDNYNLEILYETSINTFFKYSPKFGLDVSICKRNSFHPLLTHITPYYTRLELIKLGSNMNIIKEVDINRLELLDKDLHYKICKTVSKNDIDFETLRLHFELILKNNGISAVNYYSLIGSFLINNILRDNKLDKINQINYNYLLKMTSIIKNTPIFEKDYFFYRFLWDDKFISNMEVGDIFVDKGFISCTRDPFYAPGLEKSFGLILMKINVPKNKKGLCLFIENFSLFKSEEEVILAPNSKLKLISKDDNFKYYHINPKFERLVDRKYEFELVGNDIDSLERELKTIKIDKNIPKLDDNIKLNSDNMYNRLKELVKNYSKNGVIEIDKYLLYTSWFDSGTSYSDFYYNKNDKGLLISIYENDILISSIECGRIMVVNYINKFIYGDTKKIYNVYFILGKILGYHNCLIYQSYIQNKNIDIFKSSYKYNFDIYNYFKTGKYILNNYEKYDYGLIKLNNFGDRVINDKLTDNQDMTIKDLYIDIIENKFERYPKLEEYIDSLVNAEKTNLYYTTNLDIFSYWQTKDIEYVNYEEGFKLEDNYSLIFNRKRYRNIKLANK